MEREDLTKAISNPELMRRALTVLSKDPGPLEVLHEGEDNMLGCDVAYRVYRTNRGYYVAAYCGEAEPWAAFFTALATLSRHYDAQEMVGVNVACIAISTLSSLDSYQASEFPIMADGIRDDGTVVEPYKLSSREFYGLTIGPSVESVEAVVEDVDAKLKAYYRHYGKE